MHSDCEIDDDDATLENIDSSMTRTRRVQEFLDPDPIDQSVVSLDFLKFSRKLYNLIQ